MIASSACLSGKGLSDAGAGGHVTCDIFSTHFLDHGSEPLSRLRVHARHAIAKHLDNFKKNDN